MISEDSTKGRVLLVSWKTMYEVEVRTDASVDYKSFYSIIRRGFPEAHVGSILFYLPKDAFISDRVIINNTSQLRDAIRNAPVQKPHNIPIIYWIKEEEIVTKHSYRKHSLKSSITIDRFLQDNQTCLSSSISEFGQSNASGKSSSECTENSMWCWCLPASLKYHATRNKSWIESLLTLVGCLKKAKKLPPPRRKVSPMNESEMSAMMSRHQQLTRPLPGQSSNSSYKYDDSEHGGGASSAHSDHNNTGNHNYNSINSAGTGAGGYSPNRSAKSASLTNNSLLGRHCSHDDQDEDDDNDNYEYDYEADEGHDSFVHDQTDYDVRRRRSSGGGVGVGSEGLIHCALSNANYSCFTGNSNTNNNNNSSSSPMRASVSMTLTELISSSASQHPALAPSPAAVANIRASLARGRRPSDLIDSSNDDNDEEQEHEHEHVDEHYQGYCEPDSDSRHVSRKCAGFGNAVCNSFGFGAARVHA